MLNQPMMEKLLAMRLQGHGRGAENAGTRSSGQRAEFPGTTRTAGRSTMDLAREPGAGAKTESGQAERTSLRWRTSTIVRRGVWKRR